MVAWGALSIGNYIARCVHGGCDVYSSHEAHWDDGNWTEFAFDPLMQESDLHHRQQCGLLHLYTEWPSKAKMISAPCTNSYHVACVTQCESSKLKINEML